MGWNLSSLHGAMMIRKVEGRREVERELV